MADRSFGVKDIDLIGASGTPTIESPNNLNINAVNVAISTDITVAGKVSLGTGTSISSPATNVLTLGTNSVERVRIDSGGRVAIGNTDPNLYHADTNGLVLARGNLNEGITIDCSNSAGIFFSNGSNGAVDINGQLIYYHTPNDESMRAIINGSEKVRIKENGDVNVSAGGSVFINNGNLVFQTSGTGIDFSATADGSGTTTSELLDDYEEGEWTPNPFQGTNGASATSSGTRNARYIRIGKLVHVCCYIQVDKGTNTTQNYEIYGLPFVPDGTDQLHSGLSVSYIDSWATNVSYVTCTAQPNSSRLLVRYIPAAGADLLTTAKASDLDSTSNIIVGGTYITSA